MRQPSFQETLRGPRRNHPLAKDLVFAVLFNQPGVDRLYDVSGYRHVGILNQSTATRPTLIGTDSGQALALATDVSAANGFEYDFGVKDGGSPLGFSNGIMSFAWRGDLSSVQSDTFPRFGADKSTDGNSAAGHNGYTWWFDEGNDQFYFNAVGASGQLSSGTAVRRTDDETVVFSTTDTTGDHRWSYRDTSGDAYGNSRARSITFSSAAATVRMFNRGDGNRAFEAPNGIRYFLMWRNMLDTDAYLRFFEEESNVWEIWDHRVIIPAGGTTVSGSGAVTNGDDVVSGTASTSTVGSGAITEAGDTVAGVADSVVKASGAITNADDTAAGAANPYAVAVGNFTEAGTTVVGVAAATNPRAEGAITNADDTVVGEGNLPTASGSGAVTNASDVVSGAGAGIEPVTGSGAITESGDTVAGAGFSIPQAVGAINERLDVVSGSGPMLVFTKGGGGGTSKRKPDEDVVDVLKAGGFRVIERNG